MSGNSRVLRSPLSIREHSREAAEPFGVLFVAGIIDRQAMDGETGGVIGVARLDTSVVSARVDYHLSRHLLWFSQPLNNMQEFRPPPYQLGAL